MKSVALCASKKYAAEIGSFAVELRKLGLIVFEPNFSEPISELSNFSSPHVRGMIFKGITFEHFEWIRRADVCYVLNLEDYCGVSVTLEMGFAAGLGKIVVANSPTTGDPCRDVLIDFIARTPKELQSLMMGATPRQLLR